MIRVFTTVAIDMDERVAVHLAALGYDLTDLRKGHGKLCAIVEPELPLVSGKRVLHLQCHFGKDTLTLAQRGADVVGLRFSAPAIAAAQTLTAELGLTASAGFVQADLYDAPAVVSEPAGFDLVYVTWGAICWLPDIRRWARSSLVSSGLAAQFIWRKAYQCPLWVESGRSCQATVACKLQAKFYKIHKS